MRWSNLTIEGTEQRALPGYRDPAAVRRFDAPEAMDIDFYEVHARSVLNRVPAASRMPFRWTVNPYRGCTHACSYCLSGGTRILRADGRTVALRDLAVGDQIYGTEQRGAYRRFVRTEVLDKWSSIKPALSVELADGTELVASADHRFLTSRGWKHVVGSQSGPLQRPHLTLGSRLLGPGGCVDPPAVDDEYQRGYLCGMVRGDGTLGRYTYDRPAGGGGSTVHVFRLALVDEEGLARTESYLRHFGVATRRRLFSAAAPRRRESQAIGTGTFAGYEAVRELVQWPSMPGSSWLKGFLSGIFDAEGSCSSGVLRISNTDPRIVAMIRLGLARLGFDHAVECPRGDGLRAVRVRGGLPERMRFMLLVDPAITRKRDIAGQAVKTASGLNVVAIRPLDTTMRMYDITTGTGDFVAEGAISHNCFARPTHKYLDMNPGRDFERQIIVKVNAPEALRAELRRPSWKGEHVALGTNTDPYQWVEKRYELMIGIWEALRDAANPCSILTKSPLLLRDLELMKEIAARTSFTACLSIPTLDEKVWRASEPHTPNPRARLEAVAELNRAGIPTGVLIAPLMPGLNDAPQQVEPLLEAAAAANATSVGGIALHLRGEVRDVFMGWLAGYRPDLVDRYRELYRRGAYAPQAERERLGALVRRGPRASFWRSDTPAAERARPTDLFGHPVEPAADLQGSLF